MADNSAANNAAIIENIFPELKNYDTSNLPCGWELLDVGAYAAGNEKAIAVRDDHGNIYVHFNGTGNSNWGYNAAAYGAEPQPSYMQQWAVDYFDRIYEQEIKNGIEGKLYVTGHSQGGNNAQFVTIRSQYGNSINQCIALDAPGFSHYFVEESKKLDNYYQQCGKIWAFNGENDYVSCLGQESIIPDGHTKFVGYSGEGFNFEMFHHVAGMLDKDHELIFKRNGEAISESDFRKFIVALNEKIANLPQSDQARAAQIMMALVENTLGGGGADIDISDLDFLASALFPMLIDVLVENPGLLSSVLESLKVDEKYIYILQELVGDLSTLSPEDKQKVVDALVNVLEIKDGKIVPQWGNLLSAEFASAVLALIPSLEDFAENWVEETLRENGVPEWAIWFIKENAKLPIKILSTVLRLVAIGYLIYDGLKKAWDNYWNGAGRKYAAANPNFKVDTEKLRSYATRIGNVNSRLDKLDTAMNGLYWQVGFLDLLDILAADLLTGGSPTLTQVMSYLNNSADDFDAAERKAREYVGG